MEFRMYDKIMNISLQILKAWLHYSEFIYLINLNI